MNENEIQALNARVQKLEENVASLTKHVNEHIRLSIETLESQQQVIQGILELLKKEKK